MSTFVSWCLGKGSWSQWGSVSISSKPWAAWEVSLLVNFTQTKCLSIRVVLKYCLSPPHQAWLANPQNEDREKFTINSGPSKPFNNGWKSCSNTCLKPTPTPVCSLHFSQLPSIFWLSYILYFHELHWNVLFLLSHIYNFRNIMCRSQHIML